MTYWAARPSRAGPLPKPAREEGNVLLVVLIFQYDAGPEANGGMDFPALKAVPQISKIFIAYLCGMSIVVPFLKWSADKCVMGIAESHADTILKIMKPVGCCELVHVLHWAVQGWETASGTGAQKSSGLIHGFRYFCEIQWKLWILRKMYFFRVFLEKP